MIRKRRAQPEAQIQRAVFEHIAFRQTPGWKFWSTPNAGKRSLQMGAELKAQGMTAGVGDLSIVSPSGRYHELELKTPLGRLSPAQRKRQDELKAVGGDLCRGLRLGRGLGDPEGLGCHSVIAGTTRRIGLAPAGERVELGGSSCGEFPMIDIRVLRAAGLTDVQIIEGHRGGAGQGPRANANTSTKS